MDSQWIEVFAGLKNPGMRRVLGAVLSDRQDTLGTDRATEKNLQRWARIGLLVHTHQGWQLDEGLLERALAARASDPADRLGVQRFFTGLKLDTLPARPADRLAVMRHIRDAVIPPGERLSEAQLNERLKVIHPDVALLRRYMVDHRLLERAGDGSVYQLPTG